YGNYYYLGSATNPYMVAVACDNVWESGKTWTLHADTKAIICTLEYPTTFDGTVEQWSAVVKSQQLCDHINAYWIDKTITCSDGVTNICD
ncbi:MAG: hypothetical protein IKM08_08210, partial [Clostridia bacterium]|nr:hypothetical protein [Clostridia bacterium]